jgi:hypothetical protein
MACFRIKFTNFWEEIDTALLNTLMVRASYYNATLGSARHVGSDRRPIVLVSKSRFPTVPSTNKALLSLLVNATHTNAHT